MILQRRQIYLWLSQVLEVLRLNFNKRFPIPNNPITAKNEKVYTPANAIRLPSVTNKTDTHNIKKLIIIR
jgi:hypothetical protein